MIEKMNLTTKARLIMICKTSSNKIYKLIERSDKGGEGTLYDIEGQSDCVAKVFHPKF